MFAWDDLRLVLAIARAGKLAGAATALNINHSTLFRRLNALEQELGSKLFERLPTGYRPTDSGVRLIEAAERMETEALALDRDLTGRDTRLSGQLRVTCSETIAFRIITGEIGRFRAAHPGITVDLSVDNRMLDLSRREADVALRALRPTRGDLFARKLADMHWAVYASRTYLKSHPVPKTVGELPGHAMIGWVEESPQMAAVSWVARHAPASSIAFRSSTMINQLVAAQESLGVAVLPIYLAEDAPGMVRLFGPLDDLVTELWIVTHRSLKDTARVRSFMDFVGEGVKQRLALLGRCTAIRPSVNGSLSSISD